MDVRLSAEQHALRDAAAKLVDRLGVKSVADLDDSDRRSRLETALASTGWRELRCGEGESGGAPLAGTVEVALVAEELGRGLGDVPFTGPSLAAELRRLAGADAGTEFETVLLAPDLGALADTGDEAVAVEGAGARAGLYVRSADRRLVAVDMTMPTCLIPRPVDLTRHFTLGDAEPDATTIGVIDASGLSRWTAFGLAVACADLVGVMRGTIELARAYACTRQQYGVHIGSFQAVQHLLADAYVALEGSRSTALHAAWAVDNLAPDGALAAASGAKAYCARAARSVCEASIQVHGGIGNTWECLAHVYLRRALVSADLLGNVGPSLKRVLEHRLGAAPGWSA